jgi:Cupin domain
LRITELTLAPGGDVGEHNHVGPGIRQLTSGYLPYVLPKETIVYGPGDFFFETGDINHTVYNKTDAPILLADLNGPSLIPVKHHEQPNTHARRRVGSSTQLRGRRMRAGAALPRPAMLLAVGAEPLRHGPHCAVGCCLSGAVCSVTVCLAAARRANST